MAVILDKYIMIMLKTHLNTHTDKAGHWLSLEINVGVITQLGLITLRWMDPLVVHECVCTHTGPHLPVFSPLLGPVT